MMFRLTDHDCITFLETGRLGHEAVLDLRRKEWMPRAEEMAEVEQIKIAASSTSYTNLAEAPSNFEFAAEPTQGARLAFQLLSGQKPFPEQDPRPRCIEDTFS